MIEGIALGNIMVDCRDAEALCEFYHRLTGWETLRLFGWPVVRGPGGVVFLFSEDPHYQPPVWPEQPGKPQKQMHFDFAVPDVAAAVRYAVELGAVVAESQYGGAEYVTLLDPAGHPFCLCDAANPS